MFNFHRVTVLGGKKRKGPLLPPSAETLWISNMR